MIDLFDRKAMNFVSALLRRAERTANGTVQNYMHTHDEVHFHPGTLALTFEEVCVNEYGGRYGRGIGGEIQLTPEQVAQLPGCLTGDYGHSQWWDWPAQAPVYPKSAASTAPRRR